MGYHGLMCIGELVDSESQHAVQLRDVHFATRKGKLKILLRFSKTHSVTQKPQLITITGVQDKPGPTHYADNFHTELFIVISWLETALGCQKITKATIASYLVMELQCMEY